MAFRDRLLEFLNRNNLTPTELARRLNYSSGEKILRLLRNSDNSPSYQILSDIIKHFPEINARWLLVGSGSMDLEDPRVQYGFCKECIRREGIIDHLKSECAAKDKRIEELIKRNAELLAKPTQTQKNSKAS